MSRPMDFWYKWDYREWTTDLRYQGLSHHSKGILMDIRAGLLNNWRNSVECPVHSLAVSVRSTPEDLIRALDSLSSANIGFTVEYKGSPDDAKEGVVLVSCDEVGRFIRERESALEADRSRKKKGAPKDSGGKKRKRNGNPRDSNRFPPLEEKRIEEIREEEKRVDESTYEDTRVREESKPPRNETWPHAHKPQPSPEFLAAADVYRSTVQGIVDLAPAWEQWRTAGIDDYPDMQLEICDAIRQQGEWRDLASECEIEIPQPVRFSFFLRDHRWKDQPWTSKLKEAIEEDGAPSWYEIEEAKYKARRALELEGGSEVASG